MASKYNEGKSGTGDESQDVINLVQEFCMSDGFEQEFEMFAKEHSHIFQKSLEFSVHSAEHPLEFHEVYHKYLNKFEGLIEDFILKNGHTIKDFYNRCQEILEKEEVFGRKKFFIQTMLAISEYENFFLLMQSEMKLNQGRK